MAGYEAFDISGWKGLKLAPTPSAVAPNEAIDALNCELDIPGSVRSRDGFSKLTASAGSTRYDRIGPVASGSTALSSGPNGAGTGADDSSVGTISWTNPGNITADDNSYATASPSGGQVTHYLKATNFGFSVPTTATILGIAVSVQLKQPASSSWLQDTSVRLYKTGTLSGNDKATNTALPTADGQSFNYGSSTDLWGVSLTPTNVNASTFGVGISVTNTGNATQVGARTASVDYISITVYYTVASTAYVLASAAASRIDAIDSDGTVATTVATASDEAASYANVGTPSSSNTYIAVGSGSVLRKYSAGSFSTVSGSPKCKYLAVQSPDNRLFAANISTLPTGSSATAASGDLIHISDAGDPETFSADNWVDIFPGDGDEIQGLCAWREFILAYKTTRFVVFYGNSVDVDGNPVFNYRPVDTGVGLISPLGLAPSPYGVFFLDRHGVYLTTGADPVLVSQDVDPLFNGGASSFWPHGIVNPTALTSASMAWHQHRLYIGVALGSSSTNDHTLVYDPQTKDWMLWDTPMGAMASLGSNPARLVFCYGTGTNDLGQYAPNAYSDDAGSDIDWHYRSGIYTVGNSPSQRGSVVKSQLVGTGSPTFSVSTDFGSVPVDGGGAQATVTLGTTPAVAAGWHQNEQFGKRFSYQIEGTASARVDSVTHLLSPFGGPGD